jgi:oligopeptide transport system permease protein
MIRYTLKRLVNAFVTLFVIATATWFLMQLLPGSPFNDQKLSPEARAQIEAKYGLDDPLLVQYVRYIGNLAQGDFGNSYQYSGKPVLEIILERLPVSAFLGAQAVVLGVIGGLLLGVIGALKHNSLADSGAALLAVLGVSVPDFVLAPLAQYWLAFKLGIFPPAFFESWWHSVLPSIVLAIAIAAVVATFTRTEMLEVLGQDYVTLAKSKGLSKVAVVARHVLRNSMIPLITIIVPLTAALVTGTLIVETVFAIPGIGEQFVRSIQVNDYSMIIGTTMLFSVFFVASYLIQDILYGMVDPRIRVVGHKEWGGYGDR